MQKARVFFKPNLDQLVGTLLLVVIGIYIAAYGFMQLGGFAFESFGLGYMIIVVPIWLIDGLKSSFEALLPSEYRHATEDTSKITAIVACKDGEGVLGQTLQSLKRKLPAQQIIVASNGSTDRTCEIAREYGVYYMNIEQPLGKVRAINRALPFVKTPYVLILDDDTLLSGASLPTGLLDEGYDAVAFRVFVKRTTWVSCLQMHEYRKSSDIGKRAHNKQASVENISGAIGLFKLQELKRQIKLHTGEFSGEDLQRTLLIHLASNTKGVVLARSIVITVAPATVVQLFRQRIFGWYPGLYANFGNYYRLVRNKKAPRALRMDAFYNIVFVMFMDGIRLLSLPIMIFYPWYFAVMYIAYTALEFVQYVRSGRVEPLWVILVYPFYGIFGLLTRVIAFAVFVYRRLAVRLEKLPYLDDYRQARPRTKLASIMITVLFFSAFLVLNVIFNYSVLFTNFHLAAR